MKKIISAQGIKLALLGAALVTSGAAFAADTNSTPRFHDRGHHTFQHHGHHSHFKAHGFYHAGKGMHHQRHAHQRAGLIVPGYGVVSRDFVDGMGLNESQLKLIEEAREAARDLRDSRKERVKQAREARAELFKTDSLNPEQALKQSQERRAQWQSERAKIDEKWLAAWNALDAQQQQRIGAHLKDKAEKAQQRAERRAERKQQRQAQRGQRTEQAS